MGYVQKHNGKYRARYRYPLGRVTSRSFPRKANAERFVREMEVAISRGSWIDPRGADQPLASWVEEFLALSRRLAPTTQGTYRRDLQRYILPRFGNYRIGLLPPDEIENWLNDEIAEGIAPSSVHRHYRILRRMLRVAVDKQPLPAKPKTSASVRSITISRFTADLLTSHLERHSATGVEGLVFPNAAGKPITASSFLSNHFKPARAAAGLECRFHDLRHTSVALAIAEGAHPKAIQARMGHSSINVTLDRHGHLFPELDGAIATSFGARLEEAAQKRRESAVIHASFERAG